MYLISKNESPRRSATIIAMLLSSSLCALLLVMRVFYSGHFTFIFLIWNLFLAWVPFGVSLLLYDSNRRKRGSVPLLLLLGVLWLLFYPNAPYIVTDFVHLYQRPGVPLWFDLAMIASFAWTGLLIGFVSLYLVQSVIRERIGRVAGWGFVLLANGLSGFGIYLGRFQRWNSWDIVFNTDALLSDVWSKLAHPLAHPQTLGVSLIFGMFLLAGYLVISTLLRFEAAPSDSSSRQLL
jgi:uncharacterized membrane protein